MIGAPLIAAVGDFHVPHGINDPSTVIELFARNVSHDGSIYAYLIVRCQNSSMASDLVRNARSPVFAPQVGTGGCWGEAVLAEDCAAQLASGALPRSD